MDRHESISTVAGLSDEDFAVFLKDVRACRAEIVRARLDVMSTADLRARGRVLTEQMTHSADEQHANLRRQFEHIEWIRKLGDTIDEADVDYVRLIARGTDRATDIVSANAAELYAVFHILEHRRKSTEGT
jgi:hypothetical protein